MVKDLTTGGVAVELNVHFESQIGELKIEYTYVSLGLICLRTPFETAYISPAWGVIYFYNSQNLTYNTPEIRPFFSKA